MQYIYDKYDDRGNRLGTTTNVMELSECDVRNGHYVNVYYEFSKTPTVAIATLVDNDGILMWQDKVGRAQWAAPGYKKTWDPMEPVDGFHVKVDPPPESKDESYGKMSREEYLEMFGRPAALSGANMTLGQLKMEKDHINPDHYQAVLKGPDFELQWLEHLQYHVHFRDPKVFIGAVEMQVRKYLDRVGKKDSEVQDLSKALWYLKFMLAYTKNDGPIKVKDIEQILSE